MYSPNVIAKMRQICTGVSDDYDVYNIRTVTLPVLSRVVIRDLG